MCYHVLMAILLPVGPNLVDEGMVEKKRWCIGWCHPAHVSSHSAVHGVMEVDSKVKLKPVEAVVRRLKVLSYVDGYYVGRQSCVEKMNNEDNVSEKNQKNTRNRSIIQLDRWIFTLSQSMKIEKIWLKDNGKCVYKHPKARRISCGEQNKHCGNGADFLPANSPFVVLIEEEKKRLCLYLVKPLRSPQLELLD